MFTMMNNARLSVGLQGVAIAEASYQHAVAYAKERVQGASFKDKKSKVVIAEHADVKRMLLSMKAQIEAMRALTYEAALMLDLANQGDVEAQARVDLLTPIVKAGGTDMSLDVTSTGVQVHGGMGFVEETGAAQFYRDARILPIYEGTNGIQAADLMFRKLIRDEGGAVKVYLSAAGEVLRDLDAIGDTDILPMRHALDQAINAVSEATSWVGVQAKNQAFDQIAGSSVPYQRAFTLLAGGVMMARSMIVAKKLMNEGHSDKKFLEEKINTAIFYADHLMSMAVGHVHAVTKGVDTILAYEA